MQFPYNVFSDLLAEFQKYLSDRIPRSVYWALLLVVVALGSIIGYITGWSSLLDLWNRLDIFYKLALSGVVVLIFLLFASVLSRLQSVVERGFQGDWPLRLGELSGRLQQHRAIWQGRNAAFQEMTDLYGKIEEAQAQITQWGQWQNTEQPVVRIKHPLPRYQILTSEDLETVSTDTIPDRAIQSLSGAIGTMTVNPLDGKTILTNEDVIDLPAGLNDAAIIAIAAFPELVPAGLVQGDRIIIYTLDKKKSLHHLNASLLAVQQITREEVNATKRNLLHLTVAISPAEVGSFIFLTEQQVLRIVCLSSQTPDSSPATTGSQYPITAGAATSALSLTSDTFISELFQLDEQYKTGQHWLKCLQEGMLVSEIPSHMELLDKAFAGIDQLSNVSDLPSTTKDQLAKWRSQVNDYRNKWIYLLDTAFKEIEYRIDQNQKAFYLYYPSSLERVAPTVIGNVFRAVDSYCNALYGLDISLVLPRLQVVMEESTRDQLSKAHDQLALFECFYLGSVAIGIIGTILAFWTHHYFLALLLWLLALPIPQIFFYPAAVSAALDYAVALRLAIDRGRGKVLNMAGFSLPTSLNQEQEKAFWKEIQQWWIYGTPPGNYVLTAEDTSSAKAKDT